MEGELAEVGFAVVLDGGEMGEGVGGEVEDFAGIGDADIGSAPIVGVV